MKRLMVLTMAVFAAVAASALSLADARGKISEVIDNPQQMTSVMKQLSAADQKAFVAEVNKAINDLGGSAEERAAKAVNVNSAALAGAAKDNMGDLIAEIYATASLENLTAINEAFAKDLLNRSAVPGKTYTDEKFAGISKSVVDKVNARVAGSEDAAVRGGFAALTMIRASNGTPASLAGDLAATLGDSAKIAKDEWFPAALGKPANYDPMLSSTKAEKAPDVAATLMIAGPQRHEALLSAMLSGEVDPLATLADGFGDWSQVQPVDMGLTTIPRSTADVPWNPEYPRGQKSIGGAQQPTPEWNPVVPPGYRDQTF